MKKWVFLTVLAVSALLLSNCSGTRKLSASRVTYEKNIMAVVQTECTPCHLPEKGGKKKPYDNYTSLKTDIDEIIRRIELSPGDKGFMPMRRMTRLSDSTINLFRKWRTDGLPEK